MIINVNSEVKVVPVYEKFKTSLHDEAVSDGSGEKLALETVDVESWNGGKLDLRKDASHFVIVCDGEANIQHEHLSTKLHAYQYGAFSGAMRISGEGNALIISSVGYNCMSLLGGPLEDNGRLRYVDGCTNSLLLAPPVKGEPCLNFLNLPSGTHQTPHTHPTLRVGMVVSGNGGCGTKGETLVFEKGSVFIIPPNALHSFQTDNENIRIILFHPDSVVGPTHTDQTMLNNTFIDGVSAKGLTKLHTYAGANS